MLKQKVLIIEDDPNIVRFLELELCYEGYSVEKEYDGLLGLQRALNENFDLILLDIMLPSLSGMEVLHRLRLQCQTPVILLTARDTVMDKVLGLDEGAADYVTKPFAIEELLARMRAVLRPTVVPKREEQPIVEIRDLKINKNTREVFCCGELVELTRREFDLLAYLMDHQNVVCSRDLLMEQVWEYDFRGQTNLVDVYIRYLRTKLDYRFHKEFIYTIRGVGYIVRS